MGNYYLYQIAFFFVRILPIKVSYALGIALAQCHYLLCKEDRNAVRENLKVVLGQDKVPEWMVRAVFSHFARYLVEFFTMTKRVNADFVKNNIRFENIERFNEALVGDKGCIVVTAHVGNWELAGAVFAYLGYPLAVVALPHVDPDVNEFFNRQREFFGEKVIPSSVAVRRVMEYLKQKHAVAILSERDFTKHGLVMDFLGKPTMIPKGAAIFSLKTGAAIVPSFFVREQDGKYALHVKEPIFPPMIDSGEISEDVLKNYIRRYLVIIEEEIRRNPTQWLMFRRFWMS